MVAVDLDRDAQQEVLIRVLPFVAAQRPLASFRGGTI
jgi:hypothetical protein